MGSSLGQLNEIWAMLDDCAPGHVRRKFGDHNFLVTFNDLGAHLPLGAHGRGRTTGRAEIELGHVRQMARLFRIEECAHRHFPQIKPPKPPSQSVPTTG